MVAENDRFPRIQIILSTHSTYSQLTQVRIQKTQDFWSTRHWKAENIINPRQWHILARRHGHQVRRRLSRNWMSSRSNSHFKRNRDRPYLLSRIRRVLRKIVKINSSRKDRLQAPNSHLIPRKTLLSHTQCLWPLQAAQLPRIPTSISHLPLLPRQVQSKLEKAVRIIIINVKTKALSVLQARPHRKYRQATAHSTCLWSFRWPKAA